MHSLTSARLHNKLLSLSAILAIPLSFSISLMGYASSAEDTGVTLIYPENEAVDLGMGWNLHKNKSVTNVCIKNFETFDVNKNEKEESFHEGNNSFSLKESMDVSYSESVSEEASGMGAEEHASESGQMSLAASFDQSQDDRYVLAKQHMITKWTAVKSTSGDLIELTDSAKNLLDTDPEAFHKQCGHGYVARVEYGGSFYALFNMHTSSYTVAEDFKASFEESAGASDDAGLGSGSVDVDSSSSVDQSLSSTVKNESIDITVLETGGEASRAGTNIDSVLEQYASFPVRASKTPSEFRLVVFPYPSSNGLAQAEGPLMALGREYGKWEYLARTIGKMIMDEHTGKESRYTEIPGVTATKQDLADMQNMAQAKLDRISDVAGTCMKLIKQDSQYTPFDFAQSCTLSTKEELSAKKNDLKITDTQLSDIDENYNRVKFKDTWIDIAESDIYYLVRLPFQHSVFDGLVTIQANQPGSYSYQDLIFNQVMGIYKERCGNREIARFCENEAKTEAAIKRYVKNAKGKLYFKLQTLGGTQSLCVKAENGARAVLAYCDDDDGGVLFAFDHDSKLMRIAHGTTHRPVGCLRYADRGRNVTQYIYAGSGCPAEHSDAVGENFAYFKLESADPASPSTFRLNDMNAIAYSGNSLNGESCLTVDILKDAIGQEMVTWHCLDRNEFKDHPEKRFAYWRLIEPQFVPE